MAQTEESRGQRSRKKLTRRRMIIVAAAAVALVALAAAAPFLIRWHQAEIRKYSGAEADRSVQLLYDMERVGKFTVISDKRMPDGKYSEHILAQDAIDIRLWRNFERPKLPCREQIGEKYPDFTRYSREKVPEGAPYCERGSFMAKDRDGESCCHTVVLLRKGGWDYLVDFSVRESDRNTYAEKINDIADHLVLIP